MSGSRIKSRVATTEDMPIITKLVRSVRGDERLLSHKQFIVACENDKIIGCVRTVQAETDCKELASLVVLPKYRRQGIGTTLVKKILKRDSFRPLHLICFKKRENFYSKVGFNVADIKSVPPTLQRDYQRMKRKKGLDIIIMEL